MFQHCPYLGHCSLPSTHHRALTCLPPYFVVVQLKEKSDKADSAMAKRQEAFKQGRTLGISGREMFLFNPDLVGEEEGEGGEVGGSILQMLRPEADEVDGVPCMC